MSREKHKRPLVAQPMSPADVRRRARALEKATAEERGEQLTAYLKAGGDPDQVVPELIPTEEDRVRLERAIRQGANRAAKHPRGKARNRKVDALIPLVAELCVVERVLALDPLERAGLRPSQLAAMAVASPGEMYGKLAELVAGVIGGGNAPKIEVSRG